jgi:DNA replication protein DnaC
MRTCSFKGLPGSASPISPRRWHEACRRGFDVLFTSASRLLAHLRGSRADGTYERRLASYLRQDLLILDDIGVQTAAAPAPEDLYEIINERYERGR